jgi:hypothetical protein
MKQGQTCIDARGHHNTFYKCTATFRTHCVQSVDYTNVNEDN